MLIVGVPVFQFGVNFLKLGGCMVPFNLSFGQKVIPDHFKVLVFCRVNFEIVVVGRCLFGFEIGCVIARNLPMAGDP